MPISLYQKPPASSTDEDAKIYTSRMLHHYIQFLSKRPASHILDIGPVCGSNIRFFAFRSHRLSVCDMYKRMQEERRRGTMPASLSSLFDYPRGSFDGINLWDLPDHCDDNELRRLISICTTLLKPDGMLLAMAYERAEARQPYPCFIAIENLASVTLKHDEARELPYHYRPNRSLYRAVEPLKLYNSFMYTNGYREFMFRA